ncbi:hypothetical protein RIX35_005321 [Salmonella enterica]|nr:hypothetical protein [Salmonella enterica]
MKSPFSGQSKKKTRSNDFLLLEYLVTETQSVGIIIIITGVFILFLKIKVIAQVSPHLFI